jgi:hypothetical protein
MPEVKAIFDQQKIDTLKRYLCKESDRGRGKDFEIIVDEFKVVPRTSDVKEFDDYEPDVKDDTRKVSILIYDGKETNRNTRYTFFLQEESLTAPVQKSLGSFDDVAQVIQQKLDEKDREHQLAHLQEKLQEVTGKLEEAEEYSEQLEGEIEKLRTEKGIKQYNFAELGGQLLVSMIHSGAKKNPLLGTLSGILGGENDPNRPAIPPAPANPDSEATFKEAEQQQHYSEQEQQIMGSLRLMSGQLEPGLLPVINRILCTLVQYPELIIPVAESLTMQTKSNEQV